MSLPLTKYFFPFKRFATHVSLRNEFLSKLHTKANSTILLQYSNNLCSRSFATSNTLLKKARVSLTFIKHDGTRLTGTGKEGESVLDVVVNNNLDIKGYGACEGTLSCSTCHVVFKPEDFAKLPEEATDEELDMLDVALDVCSTSRLGCQVTLTKEMDGMEMSVPAVVRDARDFPADSDSAKT